MENKKYKANEEEKHSKTRCSKECWYIFGRTLFWGDFSMLYFHCTGRVPRRCHFAAERKLVLLKSTSNILNLAFKSGLPRPTPALISIICDILDTNPRRISIRSAIQVR